MDILSMLMGGGQDNLAYNPDILRQQLAQQDKPVSPVTPMTPPSGMTTGDRFQQALGAKMAMGGQRAPQMQMPMMQAPAVNLPQLNMGGMQVGQRQRERLPTLDFLTMLGGKK